MARSWPVWRAEINQAPWRQQHERQWRRHRHRLQFPLSPFHLTTCTPRPTTTGPDLTQYSSIYSLFVEIVSSTDILCSEGVEIVELTRCPSATLHEGKKILRPPCLSWLMGPAARRTHHHRRLHPVPMLDAKRLLVCFKPLLPSLARCPGSNPPLHGGSWLLLPLLSLCITSFISLHLYWFRLVWWSKRLFQALFRHDGPVNRKNREAEGNSVFPRHTHKYVRIHARM